MLGKDEAKLPPYQTVQTVELSDGTISQQIINSHSHTGDNGHNHAIDAMDGFIHAAIPDQDSVQKQIFVGGRGSGKSLKAMKTVLGGHTHTPWGKILGTFEDDMILSEITDYLEKEIDRFEGLINAPRRKPVGQELMLLQNFSLSYKLILDKINEMKGGR